MLAGWLVFSNVPDAIAMIGIGLIAVCGAAGAWLTVRMEKAKEFMRQYSASWLAANPVENKADKVPKGLFD